MHLAQVRLISQNTVRSDKFVSEVKMWVFEETVDGRSVEGGVGVGWVGGG